MKDMWNASLYDTKHTFVSTFGQSVIDTLSPKQGETILDVGCGTGDLAYAISELGGTVTGIDASDNMIEQAKHKYPHINFSVQNATSLPFEEEFEAVFSNAALHWIQPQKQALQCIYHSLKFGGRFVAELGGKGNIKALTTAVLAGYEAHGLAYDMQHYPWYFPSPGEYAALLEEIGFTVRTLHYFPRPTPLEGENGIRNWLQMFGDSLFVGLDEEMKEHIVTYAEQSLQRTLLHDGQWVADHKRIRVVAIKE